jgi:hypothetical protein
MIERLTFDHKAQVVGCIPGPYKLYIPYTAQRSWTNPQEQTFQRISQLSLTFSQRM